MASNLKPSALSRRSFLRGATALSAGAVAGFPTIVPSSALGKDGVVAPSNRLALGTIGAGGRGMGNTREFMSYPRFSSSGCTTPTQATSKPASAPAKPKRAKIKSTFDYQEICARKDIDIILIATPDHWHALAAIEAVRNGKDAYCEKPLANSVMEGRAVADVVKKHNRILQTGSQERSGPNAPKMREPYTL